jgi:hypothetical protein
MIYDHQRAEDGCIKQQPTNLRADGFSPNQVMTVILVYDLLTFVISYTFLCI